MTWHGGVGRLGRRNASVPFSHFLLSSGKGVGYGVCVETTRKELTSIMLVGIESSLACCTRCGPGLDNAAVFCRRRILQVVIGEDEYVNLLGVVVCGGI